MRFTPGAIQGSWRISLEPRVDPRGFFARSFCEREFGAIGLETRFVQCNLSWNPARGTLRGLHYQQPPAEEVKVVRCVRGSIYDVIVDLRPGSATYCNWEAFELTAANGEALYIPTGCAHGFQSLEDDTAIYYHVSAFYAADLAAGVRWDDPAFDIRWPIANPILSGKDRDCPDFIR